MKKIKVCLIESDWFLIVDALEMQIERKRAKYGLFPKTIDDRFWGMDDVLEPIAQNIKQQLKYV